MLNKQGQIHSGLLILSAGWSGVLTWLAMLPPSFFRDHLPIPLPFNAGHVIGYAILGFLVYATLTRKFILFRQTLLYTLFFIALWSFITEMLQLECPGRVADFWDAMCNMGGACFGIGSYILIRRQLDKLALA